MPTKIKISKDMILDAAFEIVRKDGMEKLSNRELASKLKCSIRPIYYQFENVEEMQKELSEYAKEKNIKINFMKIDSLEKAKEVPCIFNNWANFYKGEFISNTILNKNSFEKLLK